MTPGVDTDSNIRRRIERWLTHTCDTPVNVSFVEKAPGGMSARTYVLEYTRHGETDRLIVRTTPPPSDLSTLPDYDFEREHACLDVLGRVPGVAVPRSVYEPDPSWLGSPFLACEFIDGKIPADIPPYVLRGWMHDLAEADRDRLERSIVTMLAAVHRSPVLQNGLATRLGASNDPLAAHLDEQAARYEWGRAGIREPAIERALDLLTRTRPSTTDNVLLWGDSRVGNVIVRDAQPVAFIDWELASVGPRQLDVAWLVFMHQYFQHVATSVGKRGLPTFLTEPNVCNEYASASGQALDDMTWYMACAALRFSIIAVRSNARLAAQGKRTIVPVTPLLDELVDRL